MDSVLITGAGGFIGSHLTEICFKKGYKVKAFVHYNSRNSWGWLEHSPVRKDIEVVTGDIRDFDMVYEAVKNADAVFHLAALIGIPYSYISPLAYIKTNIEGTYNVLQSAKLLSTKNILITSTSETYGTAQYIPIDERHPLVGQSPYSATKIAADQIALSYFRSFNLPVKIIRPFNTYGPRQSARAIIPTIITQLLTGQKKLKLGNLNPTRDLTYVEDTARGFLEIFNSKSLLGEVVNIGSGKEISIGNLVKMIGEIMGIEVNIVAEHERIRPPNSEVERLLCDNSKIINNTGWINKVDLKEGLSKTIEWIQKHIDIYKAELYNL
ncbi:MAG: NAD-dependent dehydratase [Caldithrix sp. RBG_13_44_9]|nr:MAG: NAD-dependent dehydratase [Caldithrix sp. RBG_13_44_9]